MTSAAFPPAPSLPPKLRLAHLRGIAAWFCLCVSLVPAPRLGHASAVSGKAPEFVRPGLNVPQVDLKSYQGKVVLLNFWATWCAPCLVEIPRFMEWQRDYGAQGLQVIGVSMDDSSPPVRELLRKLKINYPVLMGDERLGELYGGVLGLPVTYLIDKGGRLRARFEGETDLRGMEKQVKALLSAPPSR